MNQETHNFVCFPNFFEDSQHCANLPLLEISSLSSDQSHFHRKQNPKQSCNRHLNEKKTVVSSKIQKNHRIRTSRNVQKTYHNILKHWLQNNKHDAILPKYNEFFNQRVYFILVLDEITKQIDGQQFASSYQKLALEVITKKKTQILSIQSKKEQCQHVKHLWRVIGQIEFSIKACKQFISGNVFDSIQTVYKRNQSRITQLKEFKKALQTYREVTGHQPVNF